ncbi:hypothetical protein D7Y13_18905 [Corallococcus praedator]|uniref:Lipoprotein n=1 Tax=Corallococcus praedator TaxID=2316724 RepID=A0ABX9QG52_9BACT|nr:MULTISPECIES: hypothetical protein [Corallococcus]RKH30982.1 hypothetical protein D7X75_20265 [Corallococcus sp. CA031C]RKI06998.1 hypothetical protein D7Y13_18905 [Corallococcus praedator]
MPRPLSRLALLACALTLGCGSGTPYYRLDWGGADTVTVTPGDSVPYDLAVQRIADNLGELRISVAGTPVGVTMGPDFVLPAGETIVNTTLTISVAATTTTYGLGGIDLLAEDPANDVTASGGIAVAILPPPVNQPDFTVTVTPRQVDLIPGARSETTVTVTRAEGFTGELVITLESPTQRLTADALTLAEGQTSAEISVSADRSLTLVPVITRFVATAPDGRTASTGFTFNLRSF